MAINQNIKTRRLELELTLEEVAKIVGVSRQTIQRYESGVIGNIPSDKIEKLAIALKTKPAQLMGWVKAQKKNYTVKTLITSIEDLKALWRSCYHGCFVFTNKDDNVIINFYGFLAHNNNNYFPAAEASISFSSFEDGKKLGKILLGISAQELINLTLEMSKQAEAKIKEAQLGCSSDWFSESDTIDVTIDYIDYLRYVTQLDMGIIKEHSVSLSFSPFRQGLTNKNDTINNSNDDDFEYNGFEFETTVKIDEQNSYIFKSCYLASLNGETAQEIFLNLDIPEDVVSYQSSYSKLELLQIESSIEFECRKYFHSLNIPVSFVTVTSDIDELSSIKTD